MLQKKKITSFFGCEKNSFENFSFNNKQNSKNITREEAIKFAAESISHDAVIVSTTGMPSRELFEHRLSNKNHHNKDFLTVGGMGHANQISLGFQLLKMKEKYIALMVMEHY